MHSQSNAKNTVFVDRVQNYIGGQWKASANPEYVSVANPATGESLGSVPMGSRQGRRRRGQGRAGRLPRLARHTAQARARYLFDLRNLMEEQLRRASRHLHAGARQDARGEQGRRAPRHRQRRDGARHAVDDDDAGQALEQIATGIDCGERAPADGRLRASSRLTTSRRWCRFWFLPYAIATGNTVVVKPSEQVPFSQVRLFELMHEIGCRPAS